MDNIPEARKIEIGPDGLKTLNSTRRWTMFLAVSGFISLGLIVILGIITGTFLTAFNNSTRIPGIPDSMLVGGFILLALIDFFPVVFLFRFSKHIANAVTSLDNREMLRALKSLKRFFLFLGVILIILIMAYIGGLILFSNYAGFLKGL